MYKYLKLEGQIDTMMYELYGLSDDEVAIVESSIKGQA
jgi:hypothetical protein